MFATIGRTWNLAKASWGVLMKDKELIFFPVLTGISVAILFGIFAAIAIPAGTFEAFSGDETARAVNIGDVVLVVLMAVSMAFAAIFFNSALVAAAIERLRGGDPTVRSGIRAILPHTHNILGWAIISASVGLVLQALRSNTDNILGRIALSLVGGVWAYMTFFVVPVLVVRGLSPFGAIKESSSLFKRTWGEQVTSNFGFGIFMIAGGGIAFLVGALLFAVNPIVGISVGVMVGVLALSVVAATEGIFKAALFEFAAEGRVPSGFEGTDLAHSYDRSNEARGFGGPRQV